MIPRATEPPGHAPTLFACFLHFDVCFMLWVLIGALGPFVFDGTHVQAGLKGLLIGVPILTGSLLRVPLGMLSDRFGGRVVALALLGFLFVPLSMAWLAPAGLATLLPVSIMLGTAGASFAVVLPLASRWYPAERQGLVMGIAAAGNSGTVLANIFAPRLAVWVGWQNVFGLALLPLALALVLFLMLAREAPSGARARRSSDYLAAIAEPDAAWFCAYYCVTFGGYVGLSSFLPVFLHDQFGVAPVVAGSLTAAAAFGGSMSRPLGGYLADRLGGVRMLQVLFFVIGVAYLLVAAAPDIRVAAGMVIGTMIALGLGNGVVFQLVPQRFPREIGIVTGLVGAAGGIGGFLLPTLMGTMKQTTGAFAPGFMLLAVCALGAAAVLRSRQMTAERWSDASLAAD
ncbi:MAG TPA: MFS transporter [Vicinamibacterales bacterium]|nr:MFS transporter [Vicinamibacterales bacterium]